MYNGIGLQTARGSGTNGYVQTNKFFVRPRTNPKAENSESLAEPAGVKKANKDILEHDRKRQIELQVLVLQEKLEEQGYTDDEITEKVAEARKELEMEHLKSVNSYRSAIPSTANRFSDTQTHQVAARKEKQLEIMRAALNIKNPDEAKESPTQDQQLDNEAPISDDDERNHNKQLKKNEPGDKSGSDIEEGELVKTRRDQVVENLKFVESKRDAKYVGKKKGDGRTKHDCSSDSYSSDEDGKRPALNETKKRRRHDTESESDSDLNIRRSREQHVRHKRSYSDDSESDGCDHMKNKEKIGQKRDGYIEKLSDVDPRKYDKYSKKENFEGERSKNYDKYRKQEDSEEGRSEKYTGYGKSEDYDKERSNKYDKYSKRKDFEVEPSKIYDKYSKREDSERRSENEDEKRSKRKELDTSSKGTGKIHDISRRDHEHEKSSRNSEVAHAKSKREDTRSRRNRHDTDDDSLDGKEDLRVISGKKQFKKRSRSSSSSESESELESESTDTASDDSRYKRRSDRKSKSFPRYSETKRESKMDEPKGNDRYEARRNDIVSSRSQDTSRKREVEESAASKEKEKLRDNRCQGNRDRPSESRRGDNKEQVAEEEQNKTERGSRKRSDNEERYDDKKRGRYDSYDHKHKEDLGRHRRR